MTRRTITATTAAALGLLGAILGTASAVIAAMAWTHSGLTATAGSIQPSDLLILLIGSRWSPWSAAGYSLGVSRQRSPGGR